MRVIVPGRCYRYEAQDATHEWMFYQVEGLAVDQGITMADLKGTLFAFARHIFGSQVKVRFRCDYFPFVEPGVDMGISTPEIKGGDWLEILGAGMVHPRVLQMAGYDPEKYTGFAFGMGPERIAMLKYGITDIRQFYAQRPAVPGAVRLMKVPLSWLRELVDITLPLDELVHRLNMSGTEVEAVIEVGKEWEGIAVATVVALDPHPNADTPVRREAGRREPGHGHRRDRRHQPVRRGAGAVHPPGRPAAGRQDHRGGDAARHRLGRDGLLGRRAWAVAGPDRHLHPGRAGRERDRPADACSRTRCSTCTSRRTARTPCPWRGSRGRSTPSPGRRSGGSRRPRRAAACRPREKIAVSIPDPDLCRRFTAAYIADVKIGPSPLWLQRRLHLAGVRPISNVVDATNYTMLELGQPQHAFDADALGPVVMARRARPGERLVTLDDVERILDPEMLVIADAEKPVAVGGIMGGGPTEVCDATRNVLLETANFLPASIRKTSAALRLPSEASRRYERGIDPDLALRASQRTVALLAEIAGGTPPADIVDVYPGQAEPQPHPGPRGRDRRAARPHLQPRAGDAGC